MPVNGAARPSTARIDTCCVAYQPTARHAAAFPDRPAETAFHLKAFAPWLQRLSDATPVSVCVQAQLELYGQNLLIARDWRFDRTQVIAHLEVGRVIDHFTPPGARQMASLPGSSWWYAFSAIVSS